MKPSHVLLAVGIVTGVGWYCLAADESAWQPWAPRTEIRPEFRVEPDGGPNGQQVWVISAGDRVGLDGAWRRTFPVQGGQYYRFSCWRKTEGVPHPPRETIVQIWFQDDRGRLLRRPDGNLWESYLVPEGEVHPNGWTRMEAVYQAPAGATQALVELRLRWARNATVFWAEPRLEPTDPPAPRLVRLAAVHYRPQNTRSPQENYEQFARFVRQAAAQRADLIVLPEAINFYGMSRWGKSYADVAEPIPGPATQYFGQLAREYDTYIVVPIIERDGHVVYNSAALVGPDGGVVGVYRKVCLPREEYNRGVCAGTTFPVFQTRFGKVGIMICWDVHFPEVARQLQYGGAEVIALPIWGGMPRLAAARALENQVYLVTATYTDISRKWMLTAIWGPTGDVLARATDWGSVVIHEVDLNRRHVGWFNIGDFKGRIPHERPYIDSAN